MILVLAGLIVLVIVFSAGVLVGRNNHEAIDVVEQKGKDIGKVIKR